MTKRRTAEEDKAALKTKVAGMLGKTENPEAGASLKSLRKRLKRTQRKLRTRAARIMHAAGKKGKTA